MNEKNLIPFTSVEQARENGRKGGLVRSQAKKTAAKIREMKKRGLTNEDARHLYNMLTSEEYSASEILLLIFVYTEEATEKEWATIIKLRMDWHKMWHGSRSNRPSTNVNTANLEPVKITFSLPEEFKKSCEDNRI